MSLGDRAKLYAMYMIPSSPLRSGAPMRSAMRCSPAAIHPLGKLEGGGKRSDYILTQYPIKPIDIILVALMVIIFVVVGFLQFRYGLFSMENSPLYQYLLSRF